MVAIELIPRSETGPSELAQGWVSAPRGRGTINILFGCVATILLCSWSVLCLNLPEPGISGWKFFRYKLRWQLFAIFFLEVVATIAGEQWESANQNVRRFQQMGFLQWTMSHAFFADMGGFMLQSPDFPAFPVDGEQLAYLIEYRHMEYPNIDYRTIKDRNKADGFARVITSIQIAWFFTQCLARWQQDIDLSTLEITTFATIIATLNTMFFWYHKPLDVETLIILRTESSIQNILSSTGD